MKSLKKGEFYAWKRGEIFTRKEKMFSRMGVILAKKKKLFLSYFLPDTNKSTIFVVKYEYKKENMPEICRFFGIIIMMFADDHNPPHFHIRYGDYEAIITIDKGIVKGEIPRNALKHVFLWMELHKKELEMNWIRLQNGEEPLKITPLK